jgi:hypothetical protein
MSVLVVFRNTTENIPRAVMIKLSYTPSQLTAMMGPVWFPVPAVVAKSRYTIGTAGEYLFIIKSLESWRTWVCSLTNCKSIKNQIL